MMPLTFRSTTNEAEIDAFTRLVGQTFRTMSNEPSRYAREIGEDNLRVAILNDRIVGTVAIIPCGQFFGGRRVEMHGIAAVAVDPLVRGQRIATMMMNETMRELHERGVALSTLYPATQPLYRASGYEQAGESVSLRVDLRQIRTVPASNGSSLDIREQPELDEAVRKLERSRAVATNGAVDRTTFFWNRVRLNRAGKALPCIVVAGEDGLEGVMWYETTDCDEAAYAVYVRDIVFSTPRAARALLNHLLGFRTLVARLTMPVASADALLYAIDEQRYRIVKRDIWMTRIVKLEQAITQRGWPARFRGELHFDIADDLLPGNAGRWHIEIADGRAAISRGGDGRIRADIRGLASLYTGFRTPAQLRQTGQLNGDDDDLALARSAFAGPTPCLFDRF